MSAGHHVPTAGDSLGFVSSHFGGLEPEQAARRKTLQIDARGAPRRGGDAFPPPRIVGPVGRCDYSERMTQEVPC